MSRNPKCSNCNSATHVILINQAQKIGTVVGGVSGVAGYASAFSGARTVAVIGSFIPVARPVACGIAGVLTAFLAGSTVGNQVGQCLDRYVISKYRCNSCGINFES